MFLASAISIRKAISISNCFNRLQETLDQVRRQGEEEVRNLKVHLEELEEDRKDLKNKLRRFEIGGGGGIYLHYLYSIWPPIFTDVNVRMKTLKPNQE